MNYQQRLDSIIQSFKVGDTPTLMLHACCAPCSSYVLEYLSEFFSITCFYYNPNIFPVEEYNKRVAELQRLISCLPVKNPVSFLEGRYEPAEFYEISRGLSAVPEGGERCFACYRLRMEECAREAKAQGFDYFTTTLSISPLKNAAKINEIGEELSARYGVMHLTSDFKKKGGYQRSIELSKQYDLYRQNFCGCIYSKQSVLPKPIIE